jgi:hypothetical protein
MVWAKDVTVIRWRLLRHLVTADASSSPSQSDKVCGGAIYKKYDTWYSIGRDHSALAREKNRGLIGVFEYFFCHC